MNAGIDLTDWLETALPRLMPGFLAQRRWFGSKARTILGTDFEDAVWLAGGRRPCALVFVSLRYGDGGRERYVLLLAFVQDAGDLPVIGRLEQAGAAMWAVEASTDSAAAYALLRGFSSPSRNVPMLRGGQLCYRDAGGPAARILDGDDGRLIVRPVGAEQSNTSLRLDDALVFKLFRKVDDGVNPELEVGRFLTAHSTFRAAPQLQGSLTYAPARGGSTTVGVLQDWIDNRGDGWSYVVARLRQSQAQPIDHALRHDLLALGATTGELHAALSTNARIPAFVPEPITGTDFEDWRAGVLERVRSVLRLVESTLETWPVDAQRLGRTLLDARGHAAALVQVPELRAASARFQKIRIHGDFHLGQTLKTADGFVVIDFEGEPARPLAERRLKHCALKDVAGMIRSLDYAVETARLECPTNPASREPSARRLREYFLEGYLGSAHRHNSVFLPQDHRVLEDWIDFFELEKALYEVEYEINNRPAWLHIPLRGILQILERPA